MSELCGSLCFSQKLLLHPPIVRLDVELDVSRQAIRSFGGAPSPPEQAIDIGPEHRGRVIEGEERIEEDLFEFSLSHDAAALALKGLVPRSGKAGADPARVGGFLIRLKQGVWVHDRQDL